MKPYLKITLTLFITITIVLGFALPLNMPPGWYQQTLPVSDQINDIFFLDTSIGWVVTQGRTTGSDTGYIMKTTNGGNNWIIQHREILNFNVVQFTDVNTGYAGGNDGVTRMMKTTNGGLNWYNTTSAGSVRIRDMQFINKDTGWACDETSVAGGLFRTINGSSSWQQQLGASSLIKKIFFISKDTGWALSTQSNSRLYKTLNSGINWNLIYTFSSSPPNIFFPSKDTGYTSTHKTTNGGFNWITMNNNQGGIGLYFINNTTGFNCTGFSILQKTVDGLNWYSQVVPMPEGYSSIQFIDSLKGWCGGSILIRTDEGGGPYVGIQQIGNEIPSEYSMEQNYPNPFNPVTYIKYHVKRETSNMKITVFDITGMEVTELVNQKQSAGTYMVDWNAAGYSSGIYFYTLTIEGKIIETRKMALVK